MRATVSIYTSELLRLLAPLEFGKYTVRYDQVNAMLLNEFLKAHQKMEEQGAIIAQLKFGIEILAATVKEQAAQIRKVTAQLEASKSAPQVDQQCLTRQTNIFALSGYSLGRSETLKKFHSHVLPLSGEKA
jgi:hypothetical protein